LGLDGIYLKQQREKQLMGESNPSDFNYLVAENQNIKYPNVYQLNSNKSVISSISGKFVLPEGTVRIDDNLKEEISIPASHTPDLSSFGALVAIAKFEEWIQPCFLGYKSLNRLQSIVYPIAFETNDNMLVCAPTGAGKTDVAMLTILNTISQHRNNDVIEKDDFKIVYVAPMKALAAEVVRKFEKRLKYLKIQVRELTGKTI
jgi:hypothetical protein